ncbi:PREDICTED: N-acetyltransferase 9-like protein [Bactrocera latifrons]|uniref:N-acetyltransferase 9-like protein n=1 Tax=Bactrocera latifrons TaxID=174628 RepID=A0A0K8VPV8_BACLA|nr:PREDICTED: N-acetyltransferase 9-like protein [Bactrocera latifrons]XP_018793102.1 PREDICTED: N-acetyltransferase 9-like protein [Bactrocera latifrons]XP_018793103.1 PREDICTED: N-acetyltransferase 9-like protein [Bactrocera latifrons]XP_018793104.1 PREDICTED: N-acetyltransferase 9-like protein [Bactrocera latifrons]XP_018793105.1 PREDICTED: N-acetyltransferase 9-like protein [Bactrocera latifrons]XP_018793107.1 PREDICTED: N-acetyltransferase 9-like protein [Bactrocera latifrons]
MRLNENTKIVGKKVILVPYCAAHVEKYHEWMKSPELQELTASEPLSLQEEYEMQRSWREDEDKCTFLVLCRTTYEQTDDEIYSLVGDTNLFLRVEDGGEGTDSSYQVAEAEIMIAEPEARSKGCGWEAMLLLLKYALRNLNIKQFEVKIGTKNAKSLRMFSKMHFKEVSRSAVFEEITMVLMIDEEWIKWLDGQVTLHCENYRNNDLCD